MKIAADELISLANDLYNDEAMDVAEMKQR